MLINRAFERVFEGLFFVVFVIFHKLFLFAFFILKLVTPDVTIQASKDFLSLDSRHRSCNFNFPGNFPALTNKILQDIIPAERILSWV